MEHIGLYSCLLHAFLSSFMRRTAAANTLLGRATLSCCLDLQFRIWAGSFAACYACALAFLAKGCSLCTGLGIVDPSYTLPCPLQVD